jgi:PST family polysaccharide transporter
MKLAQTTILSALAAGSKTAAALLLNKVLALLIGPSGYAAIGQFQNFISIVFTFGSGAIATGVTKYTSQYRDDPDAKRNVWRGAAAISTVAGSICSLGIAVSSPFLATRLLHDPAYWDVFIWLAIALILLIWNALLLALLNGERQIGRYVAAQIIGTFLVLVMASVLAMTAGLRGALIAIATGQSLGFLATLFLCRRQPWFRLGNFFGRFDRSVLRKLSAFAAMTISAAVTLPLAQIMVRASLVEQFGWTNAGYWDGMQRISTTYLAFAVVVLNTYYIPRMSAVYDPAILRKEAQNLMLICIISAAIISTLIFHFREFIIITLLDRSFLPMMDLFFWQAVGDIFRIGSAIFSMVLIAKAMAKNYILLQISLLPVLPLSNFILTQKWGFEASSIAYALTYTIYFVFSVTLVLHSRIFSLRTSLGPRED